MLIGACDRGYPGPRLTDLAGWVRPSHGQRLDPQYFCDRNALRHRPPNPRVLRDGPDRPRHRSGECAGCVPVTHIMLQDALFSNAESSRTATLPVTPELLLGQYTQGKGAQHLSSPSSPHSCALVLHPDRSSFFIPQYTRIFPPDTRLRSSFAVLNCGSSRVVRQSVNSRGTCLVLALSDP